MNLLCVLVVLLASVTVLMILMGSLLSKKTMLDIEKLSPFECGFTTKYNARLPFSLRFFLVCIIFLVFDVELVLLFPFILSVKANLSLSVSLVLFISVCILVVGLYHEWNQGSLDWGQ